MNIGHVRFLRAAGVLRASGKSLSEDALKAEWQSVDAVKKTGTRPLADATAEAIRAFVAALMEGIGETTETTGAITLDLALWTGRLDEAIRPAVLRALQAGFETGAFRIGQALAFDPEDARIAEVAATLIRKASGVPGEVRSIAETAAREAVASGATRAEIVASVEAALADVPAWKAAQVANTTGTGAFGAGQVAAFQDGGVTRHRWLSSRDADVREAHDALDGEEVGVGEPFSNGLAFPGDPAGDVGEVVNCRCDVIPVSVEAPEAEKAERYAGRNDSIRGAYPRLRDQYGKAIAMEKLGEEHVLSPRQIERIVYQTG